MPTPWKHPKTGSYYLNRRVPTDVADAYGKKHILKSLGTKDAREAEKRICKMWLDYQQEFDKLRARLQSLQPLREDQVEQLALLWYSEMLEEDDDRRLHEGHWGKTIPKSEESINWCLGPGKEALAKGDVSFISDEMDDWLEGMGYTFERDSMAYQKTGMAFLRQFVRYLEAVRKRNQGEVIEAPRVAPPATVVRLSDVIDDYLEHRPDNVMGKKLRAALPKFLEVVGNKPIAEIKQADVLGFFRLIQRIPSERGGKKRPKGVLLKDLAQDEITMAPATFENNYVSPIRLFFKWAKATYQDQGFPSTLTTDGVEYLGKRKEGEHKQRAFDRHELVRLFEGPELAQFALDAQKQHYYWLPVLGLFTGARINELCQINPQQDIVELEGVWCIHITADSEGDERITKSIKTGKSRIVPLHPEVIRLGFLDYVEQIKQEGHKLLFPGFKPKVGKASANAREWFAQLLKEVGIRDETLGNRLTGSHVFRHNLITYAGNHEDPGLEATIGLITGHTRQSAGISRVQQGYVSKRSIEKLYGIICKIDFGLNLPRPRKILAEKSEEALV